MIEKQNAIKIICLLALVCVWLPASMVCMYTVKTVEKTSFWTVRILDSVLYNVETRVRYFCITSLHFEAIGIRISVLNEADSPEKNH